MIWDWKEMTHGKYVDAERRAARDIDPLFFAVFRFFGELLVLSVGVFGNVVGMSSDSTRFKSHVQSFARFQDAPRRDVALRYGMPMPMLAYGGCKIKWAVWDFLDRSQGLSHIMGISFFPLVEHLTGSEQGRSDNWHQIASDIIIAPGQRVKEKAWVQVLSMVAKSQPV
jgi:hypothetical protein